MGVYENKIKSLTTTTSLWREKYENAIKEHKQEVLILQTSLRKIKIEQDEKLNHRVVEMGKLKDLLKEEQEKVAGAEKLQKMLEEHQQKSFEIDALKSMLQEEKKKARGLDDLKVSFQKEQKKLYEIDQLK